MAHDFEHEVAEVLSEPFLVTFRLGGVSRLARYVASV